MTNPVGKLPDGGLKVGFDRRLMLQFHGFVIREGASGDRRLHRGQLKIVCNAGERVGEVAADRFQRANDRDADEGSDQAIFDCRRARLVLHEKHEFLHDLAPWLRLIFPPYLRSLADNGKL